MLACSAISGHGRDAARGGGLRAGACHHLIARAALTHAQRAIILSQTAPSALAPLQPPPILILVLLALVVSSFSGRTFYCNYVLSVVTPVV